MHDPPPVPEARPLPQVPLPHQNIPLATKQCLFCKEIIHGEAIKCRFCGEIVDINRRLNAHHSGAFIPRYKLWSPGLAALLSLLIPGLGHIYKGQTGNGVVLLIAAVVGYITCFWPGLIVHIVAIATAASGNPYRR